MAGYTSIHIIYNPRSTGKGKELATQFQKRLHKEYPRKNVSLVATEYAGHAEFLAYEFATATKHPLIISASGDGGYNEVINGIMKAAKKGANPVACLLPAGNANDHYREMHSSDILKAIVCKEEQRIDLLKIQGVRHGNDFERYAHSYIGIGLSSQAGHRLNQIALNPFNQIWIVLRTLFSMDPVWLEIDGTVHAYDSIVFSNIGRMSKVFKIAKNASISDGKFEVNIFRSRSRLKLISNLLKASFNGLSGEYSTDEFSFKTFDDTLVQLDGEIVSCDKETSVKITLDQKILHCIV